MTKIDGCECDGEEVMVGIDYSITGPAMCVHTGNEWSVDNCNFLFLCGRKKYHHEYDIGKGALIQGFNVYGGKGLDVERFEYQANHFVGYLDMLECVETVAIEGYAYGARGKVFNIGENTGILKLKIIESQYQLEVLQPGEIKKFATGKGNANKQAMYDAWLEETGIDLEKIMDCKGDSGPINDVVDSYYICKLAWENEYGIKS